MISGTAGANETKNTAALTGTTIDRRSYLPFVMGFIAVLPYSSLLLSGNLVLKDGLYSDYGSFQLPVREFVSHELAEGRFPHWIPWLGCGIPLHATQQVGICYPLLTPLLWIFDANIAIKSSLFLHVILCFWGQFRIGRQLQLSVAGAAIAALICTQSGFLCAHLAVGHVALVLAYALVPWLWSSVIEICEHPSLRGVCRFAAIVAGLLLTGHPQIPYYALLFGGIWAAASLVIGAAASRRLAVVSTFAAGLVIGIAIAVVQILPTWELFQENGGQSVRGTAEYASTYALNGLDLYRLLIPSLFGNPMVGIPEFMAPDFYHEKVCYLGIITWCLAIRALFSGFSSHWPWGIAGLIGLALVVALGDSTPLFSWLCASVPGLTLFRCPGRCLSMVSILMALLAGRGFDALTQQTSAISRWAESGLAAVFAFLAVAIGFVADKAVVEIDSARWIEFAYANLRWEFAASAFAIMAAITTCALMTRFSLRSSPLIVAMVVVMDPGYFNLRCVQFEGDSSMKLTDPSVTSIGTQRFIDGDTGLESREVRYSRCVAAAVRSRTRMIGTNEGGVLPHGCEVVFDALETNPGVTLRMAACQSVVKKNTPLQKSLNDALPRIWFCPDSLQHYLDKPIKSLTKTIVDDMFTVANETHIEVVRDESQKIVVHVAPETSGTLVIADTWYPGWKCRVNKKDSEIRQAFHCFRGVPIDAGTHSVELRYEPESFFKGLGISVSGIGVLFSISFLRYCRGRFGDSDLRTACRQNSCAGWTFMSVGLPETAVEAKAAVTHESCACGTLSGEDSDMNVQGTGIAALMPIIGERASRDLRVDLVRLSGRQMKDSGPTFEGSERFRWGVLNVRRTELLDVYPRGEDMNRSVCRRRRFGRCIVENGLFKDILSLVRNRTNSTYGISVVGSSLIRITLYRRLLLRVRWNWTCLRRIHL